MLKLTVAEKPNNQHLLRFVCSNFGNANRSLSERSYLEREKRYFESLSKCASTSSHQVKLADKRRVPLERFCYPQRILGPHLSHQSLVTVCKRKKKC
ncbi:hypothetical protein CDAR_573501 [Caerostris darwini]|uniref:Uncharacterized protein n=1 Tax=Caerostris darwini TaxID=1538125 RepID=A0AAV4TBG6_9ARAC|nr:hypothetical protein CDAR_573501 [Caerostris darwini]